MNEYRGRACVCRTTGAAQLHLTDVADTQRRDTTNGDFRSGASNQTGEGKLFFLYCDAGSDLQDGGSSVHISDHCSHTVQ